jgi:AAA domain
MTQPHQFTLEVHEPFSTFTEGAPTPIPFVIEGLLPKGAFSVLGGKAKHGKSSMSRCAAVCVSKGQPFLERATEQGEVLLCSLEDSRQHVDNHLQLLGYTPDSDAKIHIVSKLAREVTQTVDAVAGFLAQNTNIKLVILDTLAKVLRAKDSGDYDEMLELCEMLHTLARETGVHIQALAHCKKVQHDDPFDNFLGSVEIRAESDTNVVIYDHRGKRLLKSETRMGVPWDDPRELCADVGTVGKTTLVKRFYLGSTSSEVTEQEASAHEKNTRQSIKRGIVAALKERGGEMPLSDCLDAVAGNRGLKFEMRDELVSDGVIESFGVPHSKTNPLGLRLLKPDWNELVIANPTPASEADRLTHELDEARASLVTVEETRSTVSSPDSHYWLGAVRQANENIARLEAEIAAVGKGELCN